MNILLVDDDPGVVSILREAFAGRATSVLVANDGQAGLDLAMAGGVDVIVLDIGLPKLDGLTVLTRLRERMDVPVLMLTARDSESDVIRALQAGADDYVSKPFSAAEVVTRAQAVVRRARMASGQALRHGDVEVDVLRGHASRAGWQLPLTRTEFDLLRVLMQAHGRPLGRAELLSAVWGMQFDPQTNLVDVHVSRLRAKLEARGPRIIQTVRGTGFRLGEPG